MKTKKIVFLYTELASYFLACIEELIKRPAIEVHIIRWEINSEAPFRFSFPAGVYVYNRSEYNNEQLDMLVSKISPSVIYVSGWMDKGYLSICKKYKTKIPVIVGFDNKWNGSIRQQLAKLISPFTILNHFTHCWIPGVPQREYALKLGFKKEKILTGFYCCDYDFFHQQYLANKQSKNQHFPKRFIYVGRYVEHKGINDLWQAFIQIQEEMPNEWELWCLGAGDVTPVQHPKIKHFGFVQPEEMKRFIGDTGVFVLPSHFEPWGVVVHEFASAGFPLICADEVGASSAFIENNFNGYIYKSGNVSKLKDAMRGMINSTATDLLRMGDASSVKAKRITPESWVKQIISLI